MKNIIFESIFNGRKENSKMPSIIFNYGEWTYWAPKNLPDTPGAMKVTFDGENRLIRVNPGESTIDVKLDIYSNWKEWKLQRKNSQWYEAITTTGGDPITETTSLGDSYFLENGWRVQPWIPADLNLSGYILDIVGNIYTREEGGNPINPMGGVTIALTRSSLPTVSIAGGVKTETRLLEVWRSLGLDKDNPQIITDESITTGDALKMNITNPSNQVTVVSREK